ncbi:hypothetical protein SFK227_2553 [Shigella flexneri K-227]|uniref:Uncharacterized protein n=1 Tax=Shigella flexneri K-227 TaxID=766147 RepID=F5NWN5_SHIFL|nr:hypothetical protein SFK227_2553 [Shigella flexneri K-227]
MLKNREKYPKYFIIPKCKDRQYSIKNNITANFINCLLQI